MDTELINIIMRKYLFFLFVVFMMYSCQRQGKTDSIDLSDSINENITSQLGKSNPKCTKVHIFFENSGSMNGFINATSEYQAALSDQIASLLYCYEIDNIKLYYINQGVYPQQYTSKKSNDDFIDFTVGMLKPSSFKGTGNVGSTKLNEILKMAMDSVDSNSISIIVSDCIYSVSGEGTSMSLLSIAESKTKSIFLEKSKDIESLSTSLIQLYSNFKGNYWDFKHPSGKPSAKLSCKRPYYLCVIGTHENILEYNKNIDVKSMDGFSNQYTISNKDVSEIASSILNREGKIGSFRSNIVEYKIKSISDVHTRNNGIFGLAVAINLSSYTMSDEDKCDTANYSICGNYRITHIDQIQENKIKDPHDCDIVKKNKMTHIIYLEATGFPNDFSISIKRNTPSWVSELSSNDDSMIGSDIEEQRKTFGLQYFVDGITKAYLYMANDRENYTKLNFKVSN